MLLSSANFPTENPNKSVTSPVTRTNHGQSLKQITTIDQLSEVASSVSSENSMNAKPDPTSSFPPQHPAPLAISSTQMSRLEETILASVRDDTQPQDVFPTGLQDAAALNKRKEWLSIENELHRVQSLASRSVQTSTPSSQLRLLQQLRQAIVEAVHFLLEGSICVESQTAEQNPFKLPTNCSPENGKEMRKTSIPIQYANKKAAGYYVWSSPQLARSAIMQEAIALRLRQSNNFHMTNARPLVILVIERCSDSSVLDPREKTECAQLLSEQESFLSAWTRATFGIADAITVAVENSNQMRQSIHKVLKRASEESSVVPALVCVHASADSTVPSDISALRTTCDAFGARLCIEGTALTLVAQPDRPSDPEECVKEAHVLLLDPGAWFGFKMCAVVTRHAPNFKKDSLGEQEHHKKDGSIEILASCDNEDEHGLATGSVLNLWTVLSRIGLASVRERIEDVTALAEGFLHHLESCPHVHTEYRGVGCIARISYAMSMEDRLKTVARAAENISKVNKAVFLHLQLESKALFVHSTISESNTYIQFSPARLLRGGSFRFPSDDEVQDYAVKLQETFSKIEPCKAGRVEFEGRIAKCRDMNLIRNEEDAPGMSLSFGAFRVVPHELSTSWGETSSSVDVVKELTNQLVAELNESLSATISKSFVLQQQMERCGVTSQRKRSENRMLLRSEEESLASDVEDDLPFIIYLNSDLDNGVEDFISIEPKEACTPVQAVRQARLAAELIISIVDVICCRWRSSNLISAIPRDLANVAGTEDFIPQTAPRDVLGLMREEEQASLQHRQRASHAFIPESTRETSSTAARNIGYILVDTDSDEGSFHSVVDYGDEKDLGTDETKLQESLAVQNVDHEAPLENHASKELSTQDMKQVASKHTPDAAKASTPVASETETPRAAASPMVKKRSGTHWPKGNNASSPSSIQQPRTRSHWLGLWSRSEKKSSGRGMEEGSSEESDGYGESDEDSSEEDASEDGDAENVESSAPSSSEGKEESEEDEDDDTSDSEEEEEDGEEEEEEEEEESSETAEMLSETDSEDLNSVGRADERTGFLGWWRRPAATVATVGTEGWSSSEGESELSSSLEEDRVPPSPGRRADAGEEQGHRWGFGAVGDREEGGEGSEESEESGESSSESDERAGEGDEKRKSVGAEKAGGGYGLNWLRRRWAGEGAAVGEGGASDGGSNCTSESSSSCSEEEGQEGEMTSDAYSDGGYDSEEESMLSEEGEREGEQMQRQEQKGRVARYLGWLAPGMWSAVAKGRDVEVRGESESESESESEDESERRRSRARAERRRR